MLSLFSNAELAAIAALLGLFVGSFLNVVIHRLPIMLEREWRLQAAMLSEETLPESPPFNLSTPRSHCPVCGHLISAFENIPVLSYLIQRGRCRHCHTHISPRYPAIELLAAALSGYAAWHFGATLATLGALLLIWSLLALTFIDFDTQLLPDNLTLPLLWLGLAFNLVGTYTDLSSAVLGAMLGYLSLWSVYWLFKLCTGKEGMGYGDFKLLAAIGAWLGWQSLPITILLSALIGSFIGLGLIFFTRHGRNTPIPFGPYLAIAGFVALFWGQDIMALFYLNFS